ncbi:MAG TPA: ABC transporter ATP-binding protein [Candidatus Sumerlaeota bacterium]|nr:MAG: putative ABC transporter ATP-binding protein YxlF [candidate division BRC1 bacterium ADurb.BinA292]HOE97117.1 ABC transporter ATP-binding protein [Candidatus Sumerlaeota bacterium]HOR27261.1 ABC transporter ATP-binding protein [Candidatus Sumerlaeota bacterium]HPK01128.1 ABC transporter ATP-binding protein [Candidatus Sumerlaeota bacterium]
MLLELDNVTVRYGARKAIDQVSLRLESRALGLLGPNGAGKSTLIRALLGLQPLAGGTARLEGLDIRRQGKRIREIVGYMPEHESYLGSMTVVRFLRFMGELCGLPPGAAMERAHEVLFYVGLGEVRYRKMEGFSYGMQQKVRLAQALIHGPRVLILDEPTNGLDPAARDDMLRLIQDMVRNSGSRLIISSHLLKDIESCCEEVVVLNKGRVTAAGNIAAMKQTDERRFELRIKGPLDPFVAALSELGCQCRLGKREALQVVLPEHLPPRRIFEVARGQRVQIRHYYARKDTLEDVFLKALEDDAGEREVMADAGL